MASRILAVVNRAKVGVAGAGKKKIKSVRFSDVSTTYRPVLLTNPLIENNKTDDNMNANPEPENFEGGTALSPTSTVEISISCRDLADKDILSKSDPICIVFHRPRRSNHWVEYMRTEVIQNNLNPDFAIKATMEYRFEMQQNLRFEIYDIDKPTDKLVEQDAIGFVECTLAQIVTSGGIGLTLALTDMAAEERSESQSPAKGPEKSPGSIILIAEELASLKDELHLTLGATAVGSRSCICIPPKTFFAVSKIMPSTGKYVVVHRGDRCRSRNPNWPQIVLSLSSLCNGDRDRKLKIEVFQETFGGEEFSVGYCETTLNKLVLMGTGGMRLISREGGDLPSTLMIGECKIVQIFTFVDYIQNGTQIHCVFSIDFTSSNGDPGEPSSLHHFSAQANRPNPYEQAIQSVGNIIQDYDNTKLFPVYGFGARIPPVGAVSHNFYVTLSKTPHCFGIHGVLESYRNCIRQIQLYGPTNFAPIIRHVAEIAAQSTNGEDYFVLLIITDGVITDMPQTKEAIVNASSYPLSIIIVGVGGADFDAMEELDGDSVRISYNGRIAERDIVQFVPYRDAYSWLSQTSGSTALSGSFTENNADYTNRFAQQQLAAEILAEIPEQLTGYMKSRGIFPTIMSKAPTPVPPAATAVDPYNLPPHEQAQNQTQNQNRPPSNPNLHNPKQVQVTHGAPLAPPHTDLNDPTNFPPQIQRVQSPPQIFIPGQNNPPGGLPPPP